MAHKQILFILAFLTGMCSAPQMQCAQKREKTELATIKKHIYRGLFTSGVGASSILSSFLLFVYAMKKIETINAIVNKIWWESWYRDPFYINNRINAVNQMIVNINRLAMVSNGLLLVGIGSLLAGTCLACSGSLRAYHACTKLQEKLDQENASTAKVSKTPETEATPLPNPTK